MEKTDRKEDAKAWAVILGLVFFLLYVGFMMGSVKGYGDAMEAGRRIDCEVKYGATEQKDIPGFCLKYFK